LSAVALLLQLYGADDTEIAEFREVARGSRRRGWWVPWNDVIRPSAVTYFGLESEAFRGSAQRGGLRSHDFQNFEDGIVSRNWVKADLVSGNVAR